MNHPPAINPALEAPTQSHATRHACGHAMLVRRLQNTLHVNPQLRPFSRRNLALPPKKQSQSDPNSIPIRTDPEPNLATRTAVLTPNFRRPVASRN
jgi:hypothetical protein